MLIEELDVFLSSDQKEFEAERFRISQIICDIPFCACIPLENRGADARGVVESSLRAVRNCNIFIGIYGQEYSTTAIKEYVEAIKHRKPCLCYVKKVAVRDRRLKDFIESELKNRFKYYEFNIEQDLYIQVKRDVRKLIFETLKDGLEFRKKEKMKAIDAQAEMIAELKTQWKRLWQERLEGEQRADPLSKAQKAFEEGKYVECIIYTTIILELFLKKKIETKTTVGNSLDLGQLSNLAAKYEIIDKNKLRALSEIWHIRNAIAHGMQTPDKKTTLKVVNSAAALLKSLYVNQPRRGTQDPN